MKLQNYQQGDYTTGASFLALLIWHFVGSPIVRCPLLPFSWLKVATLRIFGAQIGQRVCIKPGVKVKFPWRLTIGDNSWIGEEAWIDNLATVTIGDNCVISQGAYLCTGNHNWQKENFELITKSIQIDNSCWVAAKAIVLPGVSLQEGAVLTAGSVAHTDLESWSIYQGHPATRLSERKRESSDS